MFVDHDVCRDDLARKDLCRTQWSVGLQMAMSSRASYVLHTDDVIDDVTRSKRKSILKIVIIWSIFLSYSVETEKKYNHYLYLTWHLSHRLINVTFNVKISNGTINFVKLLCKHIMCIVYVTSFTNPSRCRMLKSAILSKLHSAKWTLVHNL